MFIYTAKKGETLTTIAKQVGTTANDTSGAKIVVAIKAPVPDNTYVRNCLLVSFLLAMRNSLQGYITCSPFMSLSLRDIFLDLVNILWQKLYNNRDK